MLERCPLQEEDKKKCPRKAVRRSAHAVRRLTYAYAQGIRCPPEASHLRYTRNANLPPSRLHDRRSSKLNDTIRNTSPASASASFTATLVRIQKNTKYERKSRMCARHSRDNGRIIENEQTTGTGLPTIYACRPTKQNRTATVYGYIKGED